MPARAKFPWFPFYASDWLTDPCVSKCQAATRGVWMDLLSHMHLNGRSGKLSGTVEQLAQSARCTTAVLVESLADLQATEAATVTKRNDIVTVVNRRMNREHKERQSTKLRVQRFRRNGHVTENVTADSQRSESESESKRLNDAKSDISAQRTTLNRSSLNRSREERLMGMLRASLGEDEMARAGGHWLQNHVRKHGDLVERALAELATVSRERGPRDNPAAWTEDLIKRWL